MYTWVKDSFNPFTVIYTQRVIRMKHATQIPDYRSFRRIIVPTVSALILLLLGFSAWKSVVEYRLTIRGAELQSRGYARALKEHAERAFSEADNILLDTIDHVKDHGGIDRENSALLREFIHRHNRSIPQVGGILLVNRNGQLFAHSRATSVMNVNDYFIHHRDHPEDTTPYFSRPVQSRLDNKWTFTLSRAVRSSTGAFEGLVAIAFEMEYFQHFYSSLDLGKEGRIVMVRRDGALLLSQPFKESDFAVDFSKSFLIRTYLPRSPKGTFHIPSGKALLEAKARIVSYEALDSFPIVANANMGTDEVTAVWRKNTAIQAALTLVTCGALYLLMILLLRQIKRIQAAYQRQSEQQAEISAATEAWQATFDSVADAIWVMDLDRTILRCNKATNTIFGKESGQVVGHLCCEVAHHGKTPLVTCPFQKMLDSGQRANMQITIGERWFDVSVDPIRDGNGTITGAVHIVSDISQLKQAEEQAIENEARMRGLLSAIPDAIFFKDAAGRWLLANSAGIELFCLHDIDYFGRTDLELAEIVPERRTEQLCSLSSNFTA